MRHHSLATGGALLLAAQAAVALPRGVERSTILTKPSEVEKSYDYIIVGGGTSGLTVADRLTEDGKTKVLVVEYGELSDSARISTVQGGFQGTDQAFLYNLVSVPQVNLRNKTTSVMIGKVVGGSSAVNMMMTVRGTMEDYDRWGKFFSNSSDWSWKGMLPYFRKALNFHAPNADVAKSVNMTYDASYWGNTSGVSTSWPSYQYPVTKAMIDAWRTVPGVEVSPDSGAGRTGVYWFPQFMDPQSVTRSYARTGHYSNQNRSNYHLITGSKVTKVLIDGTTATGITFVPVAGIGKTGNGGTATTVTALKEVIVAASGIHSPQILQLSGIGPKKLLTAANIPVVVDLPGVGQNFQDHPMIQAQFSLRSLNIHPQDSDAFQNATFRTWTQQVWAANKTGPNSIATGNAAAWLPMPVISKRWEALAANLSAQEHAAYLPVGTDPTVAAGYKAQMTSYAAAMRGNGTSFYNAGIMGGANSGILVDLHPLSRGTVNIDPANPNAEVQVDYRALANPLDALVMADIVRFSRVFYFNTTSMAKYGPSETSPGSAVQSDEDFRQWLARTLSPTEYHPVGTCAMMPRELGGVVDEQLRVYGVKNLRVVDSSIMPTLPGGNTCQTVYAVAEKAADIIKAGATTR